MALALPKYGKDMTALAAEDNTGAKARIHKAFFAARLKPCPDTSPLGSYCHQGCELNLRCPAEDVGKVQFGERAGGEEGCKR